jgi:hypothetical protein
MKQLLNVPKSIKLRFKRNYSVLLRTDDNESSEQSVSGMKRRMKGSFVEFGTCFIDNDFSQRGGGYLCKSIPRDR